MLIDSPCEIQDDWLAFGYMQFTQPDFPKFALVFDGESESTGPLFVDVIHCVGTG